MILAALAATPVPALGADAAAEAPGSRFLDTTELGKSKEPIIVTSDRLEYDYRSNVVVYRGAVQATQGRLKITSDTLTVTFADAKTGGADAKTGGADTKSGGADAKTGGADAKTGGAAPPGGLGLGAESARLQEIVAAGSVRIEDGTRWATGGRAVFDQTNRTLVLSEAPMLHDGANEVLGDRVIVYLDEDRSVVEGGRKRVKAVLYPDRKDKAGHKAEHEKTTAAQTAAEVTR
jgi:lipopolysaccharide export system protein LptA